MGDTRKKKIQKSLKKVESTSWLFGDNLKMLIENTKAVERISKDMKPKPKTPLKPNNGLNWQSPLAKRVEGRGGYKA